MYEPIAIDKFLLTYILEAQSIFGTLFLFPNTALGKGSKNIQRHHSFIQVLKNLGFFFFFNKKRNEVSSLEKEINNAKLYKKLNL